MRAKLKKKAEKKKKKKKKKKAPRLRRRKHAPARRDVTRLAVAPIGRPPAYGGWRSHELIAFVADA